MSREMKDSGIEWIGEIPKDWNIIKIKHAFSYHKEIVNNHANNYDRLALTLKGVIKRNKNDNEGLQPESFNNYQILYKNELVFKLIDLENIATSRVGLSRYLGIVSPAYIILKPNANIDPGYAEYYFLSMWKRNVFNQLGDSGVRSNLNVKDLLDIKFVISSKANQEKISRFLNERCKMIDNIICVSKLAIDEYQNLKQAIIMQSVTKGIRNTNNMKNSYNEKWGSIPQHWEFRSVKTCIDSVKSGLSAVSEDDTAVESGYYVLRTSAVSSGIFIPTEVKPVLSTFVNRLICPVEKDTLIVSRMNTDKMVGICAYVDKDYPNLFLPDKLWKIKVKSNVNPKFLWYSINSTPAHAWFTEISTGASASMQNITIKDFTGNHIPIPPLEEQEEIVSYLDAKCGEIDKLIKIKEQYLIELENYKQSLIYEYITGKREV